MKSVYRNSENCYCQCATGLDYANVCIGCETEETFTCPACKRLMPYSMGCDDDFYELCDDCYAVAKDAGFKSDLDYLAKPYQSQTMTYSPQEVSVPIEPIWIEIEQAKFKFSEIVSMKSPETPEDFWCVTLSDNCWFLLAEQEADALNKMLTPSVFIGTKKTHVSSQEGNFLEILSREPEIKELLQKILNREESIALCTQYFELRGFGFRVMLNTHRKGYLVVLVSNSTQVAWGHQGDSMLDCLLWGIKTISQ